MLGSFNNRTNNFLRSLPSIPHNFSKFLEGQTLYLHIKGRGLTDLLVFTLHRLYLTPLSLKEVPELRCRTQKSTGTPSWTTLTRL
jgi:hypothetical protein